ncbi:MAG: hypothetical protein LBR19_08460, partial [Bifidobacteriaceae bacterium]|nr:hypothetical protein [Bifidobacteriaceae bacterium]
MSELPLKTHTPKARKKATQAVAGGWGPGFIAKLVLMALIDAIGIFGVIQAVRAESTTIVVVAV